VKCDFTDPKTLERFSSVWLDHESNSMRTLILSNINIIRVQKAVSGIVSKV
jgi:hypothetical protein